MKPHERAKRPITKPAILNLRTDHETVAFVAELARRRKTSRTQWLRDAINLAIDIETGARGT